MMEKQLSFWEQFSLRRQRTTECIFLSYRDFLKKLPVPLINATNIFQASEKEQMQFSS